MEKTLRKSVWRRPSAAWFGSPSQREQGVVAAAVVSSGSSNLGSPLLAASHFVNSPVLSGGRVVFVITRRPVRGCFCF